MNADPEQSCLLRTGHYSVLERPGEKFRENREHMKRHDRFTSLKPSGNSTSIRRAAVSIATHIDRTNGINKSSLTRSSPLAPPSSHPVTKPIDAPVPRSTI